jgi:hypothetical protein
MDQDSLSLITVVFSVVLELLPRIKAITIINRITAPTTHIHGCVYHVLVVVVVFVLVVLLVVSCAHITTWLKHNERNTRKVFK